MNPSESRLGAVSVIAQTETRPAKTDKRQTAGRDTDRWPIITAARSCRSSTRRVKSSGDDVGRKAEGDGISMSSSSIGLMFTLDDWASTVSQAAIQAVGPLLDPFPRPRRRLADGSGDELDIPRFRRRDIGAVPPT